MEDIATGSQENDELPEAKKNASIEEPINNGLKCEDVISTDKSSSAVDIDSKGNLNNDDSNVEDSPSKPRIILTLRTSETDPEAYFSTSNLQDKNEEKKKDPPKPPVPTGAPPIENVSTKRNLRRVSNSKESVLQHAIALKEKAFGIPEPSVYKKNKSPRNSVEKAPRQVKLKPPRLNSALIFAQMKQSLQNSSGIECPTEDIITQLPNLDTAGKADKCELVEKANESSSSPLKLNINEIFGPVVIQDYNLKPTKRKKRYYKGLSYSFNNKKNNAKKRRIGDRIRSKFQQYSSSEQDTDSQNTVITSEEISEQGDSKSAELSTEESSRSSSVLFQSATGMKQNFKHTSLDVINDKFNVKPPSPSTGDSPKKPARPESTMKASAVCKAALCLCQIQEKVYMKVDNGTRYHCQAVDTIEGKQIGCCNPVRALDEGDIKLQRPSVKVTYLMFCDVHAHRLLLHNCCPTCGLFCTQGKFVICESQHMYHRKCELVVEGKRICPHCGHSSPQNDISFSIGQDKNPIFLPLQVAGRQIPCAKMTFHGSLNVVEYPDCPLPPILSSRSYVLPSGKEITAEGIPVSIEKDKLEKCLKAGLPCISNSPAQRYTYRSLYYAAKTGDIEKILNCLVSGLNPNHVFRELIMGTALHAASCNGFLTIVHILRQAGAQLDMLDKEQYTAIMLAAMNGHNDVVKYLLKAGADITFRGKDGMVVLHLAAKAGNLEACHYLLSSPRSPAQYVNYVDDGGWTSLVWSAENNYLDVLLYLLSKGADPLVRDSEHNIALHWSAFSGSVDTCEVLLHYGSDINCTNVHGDTPLHVCARQEHYPCVLVLLAQGARTDIRNVAQLLAVDCCINKPCDSYDAIKLNIQLKELTARSREKTVKILTNDITRGYEVNPIQCVNSFDDEPKPTDFVYITENCFTSHIKVDRTITSLKSCRCTDTCNMSSCTCGKLSLRCWYTDDGKLCSDFNFVEPPMIFECNPLCKCNKITCNNRVVQHGITTRFQLFRTKDKGWGVITLRPIPKGTYVCEYIGEIISDTEADTRGEDSYLFDLDNKDGETYCIDAFRYGNIARFINHSCIPNLQPVKVFVSHQDLHFPRIAFFANRDIEAYEELGFDYGEKFWIIKYKLFTCTCGAEKCRYSETTIQKTLQAYNKKLQMEESVS